MQRMSCAAAKAPTPSVGDHMQLDDGLLHPDRVHQSLLHCTGTSPM
jgi:hypothetical protein